GDGGAHDAGGKDASAADSGARIDDAGHIGDSGLIRDASTEDAGGGDGGTSDGSVVSCSSTGLAQAPTSFALPPGYSNTSGETFPSLYDPWGATSFCGSTDTAEDVRVDAVSDLTGEGKPDLVVTTSCADATVGNTHWIVDAGTGGGFAQTATSFALPPGYSN